MTNTAGTVYQVIRHDGNAWSSADMHRGRPVRRGVYRNHADAIKRRNHERAITPRGSSDWITIRTA